MEKIDLLLLAIESLDINASQLLALEARNIDILNIFPNDVEIWKTRCHNPMRKSHRHSRISKESLDSLLMLLSSMAQKFYPQIRELLSDKTPASIKELKWCLFSKRFDDLILERMNVTRNGVKKYLSSSCNQDLLYRKLLLTLALSSGPRGLTRLTTSIFEPLTANL